jgi:uncharacterized protein (TIGR03382 family)
MSAHGWAHDLPGDDVHFDHTASADHRGEDVRAFQTLWNRNHPNDMIAVDGDYGPQTEARLKMSPATGFAIGASCGAGALDADIVSVDGPDRAPPVTQVHYGVTIKNTGAATWPATTKLRLASGMTSPLHDPSWTSDTVVTTLGDTVAPGAKITVDFDVTTPAADTETPVMEAFTLDDGGTAFGTIQLALTVVPGQDTPQSSDGGDTQDGGCNAGGGNAGVLVMFAALVLRRRRR